VRPLSFLAFGALAVLGCSSEPRDSTASGGARATGGSNSSGGSAATGGGSSTGGAKCEAGPGYQSDAAPQRVNAVSAELVDLDEQPLSLEFVQVCGTDICIQGQSSESGKVLVSPGENITLPAFKFGEGKTSPRFARLLPNQPNVDFGVVHSVRLPPFSEGVALLAGKAAGSGGLTLTPAAGSAIKIDKLTFGEAEEQTLRAVQIPIAQAGDLIDEQLGLELLYAASPTSTQFCPPARLAVENSEGWEPGTAVEVLLHGVEIDEEWAPYGGWAKVSDAVVSDDGTQIETTEPGLPLLGVLGFRRK
jgi:hypothetical protein